MGLSCMIFNITTDLVQEMWCCFCGEWIEDDETAGVAEDKEQFFVWKSEKKTGWLHLNLEGGRSPRVFWNWKQVSNFSKVDTSLVYQGKPKILNISSNIRSQRTLHTRIYVALKLRLKEVSLREVGPKLSDFENIQRVRDLVGNDFMCLIHPDFILTRLAQNPGKRLYTRFYHFRTHQDGQLYCGWCQHPSERLCHYVAAYRHHCDSSCHSVCSSCIRGFWKIWTQTHKLKATLFCKSNCVFLFLLGLTEMWTAINLWFILPSYFCGDPRHQPTSKFPPFHVTVWSADYFRCRCEKPRLGWLARRWGARGVDSGPSTKAALGERRGGPPKGRGIIK